MKLGKLLAAGKSIMNGRTEVSYRSSKQIYLPKFGSAKNPFKSDASGQPVETIPCPAPTVAAEARNSTGEPAAIERPAPAAAPLPTRVAPVHESAAADMPASQDTRQRVPVAIPASMRDAARPSQIAVAATKRLAVPQHTDSASALQRFNGFLRSALGKDRTSDAKNQKGTATQTELSLDSVKVVHNDLSDVDVEVVPIKSRSAAPELPAPKTSWEYVGERLFGVETT